MKNFNCKVKLFLFHEVLFLFIALCFRLDAEICRKKC